MDRTTEVLTRPLERSVTTGARSLFGARLLQVGIQALDVREPYGRRGLIRKRPT